MKFHIEQAKADRVGDELVSSLATDEEIQKVQFLAYQTQRIYQTQRRTHSSGIFSASTPAAAPFLCVGTLSSSPRAVETSCY